MEFDVILFIFQVIKCNLPHPNRWIIMEINRSLLMARERYIGNANEPLAGFLEFLACQGNPLFEDIQPLNWLLLNGLCNVVGRNSHYTEMRQLILFRAYIKNFVDNHRRKIPGYGFYFHMLASMVVEIETKPLNRLRIIPLRLSNHQDVSLRYFERILAKHISFYH